MIRALLILVLALTACGGQASAESITEAFEEAGLELKERELNDGRIAWSSDSDEDVIAEVIEDPVQNAYLMLPPLEGDASGSFPGSRYVDVLDESLVPGLRKWIEEEAEGRSGGSWSAEREFGRFTVEIENNTDTLPSFMIRVIDEEAAED